ncbi:helix-turn-helix domain-containing protein [Enterococcus faecium]|nr:helix-turn-helix domain-containing protein [Enterococcus faecium]
MSNPVEKMTIKNLADELGVSKNTVRNQLVNSGFDLAQYKENGIIMLDKELIVLFGQFIGQKVIN